MEDEEVLVGCAISAKKQKHIGFAAVRDYAATQGLRLHLIDLARPIAPQGRFRVILNKLTDLLVRNDDEALACLHNFTTYVTDHPEVAVVDALESSAVLLDRGLTALAMQACEIREGFSSQVLNPKFAVVEADDPRDTTTIVRDNQLAFPLLCKPIEAHGSTNAHQMCVIFNEEHLADAERPCLLQEYISHNGVLYKVFVVDRQYHIMRRPSLRDMQSDPSMRTIFFSSHDISKEDSASELNANVDLYSPEVPDPDSTVIDEIVSRVRRQIKLHLFGLDIVEECDSRHLYVVDINYFPGYSGVEGFPAMITSLLKRLALGPEQW